MAEMIAVIGDGAMGTLSAIILAQNGQRVRLWSAFAQDAKRLASARVNEKFLPGHPLPDNVEISSDDRSVFAGASLAVSAVPTQFMRQVWQRLSPHTPKKLPICSVAKGIENGTLLRPTQIIADVLDGGRADRPLASLSGPSIAPEVARGLPATVTVAGSDQTFAEKVQKLFGRPYFRVYTNADLVGVEIAGATKNVIAIAAGILDGMGAGDNAKAALVTRGLAEITRLGLALGAKAETFAGLAGLGDLITTCVSPIGRNRTLGEAVGRGMSVEHAIKSARGVVEGVATTASVVELAGRHKVEMPITQAVHAVLFKNVKPAEAVAQLMSRPVKPE
ncbi:MAG: NAD(P)-dependent glycerol-3-phosphate dehydrogenase [Planctomycetes bacterium]|nr:NAD(P)-dependent glycerol-3-phosphate dehydrogenase [Planctomycetota bacterium]